MPVLGSGRARGCGSTGSAPRWRAGARPGCSAAAPGRANSGRRRRVRAPRLRAGFDAGADGLRYQCTAAPSATGTATTARSTTGCPAHGGQSHPEGDGEDREEQPRAVPVPGEGAGSRGLAERAPHRARRSARRAARRPCPARRSSGARRARASEVFCRTPSLVERHDLAAPAVAVTRSSFRSRSRSGPGSPKSTSPRHASPSFSVASCRLSLARALVDHVHDGEVPDARAVQPRRVRLARQGPRRRPGSAPGRGAATPRTRGRRAPPPRGTPGSARRRCSAPARRPPVRAAPPRPRALRRGPRPCRHRPLGLIVRAGQRQDTRPRGGLRGTPAAVARQGRAGTGQGRARDALTGAAAAPASPASRCRGR